MQKKLLPEAERKVQQNTRRRGWRRIVQVMACVVVFCTTYALILPAITLEKTQCELEEHIHTESCYEKATPQQQSTLTCTYESLGVHKHTDDCYDAEKNLLCGSADFLVHTHGTACYAEGSLICQLPEVKVHAHTQEDCFQLVEHIHEEACYETERGELTCTLEEIAGHTHGDACYKLTETPQCSLEEKAGHTHGETCSETVLICELSTVPAHTHTDACYTQQLTCGKDEIEGYSYDEETSVDVLICENTEEGHTHEAACYRTDVTVNTVTVEGHTHSDSCYAMALTCGQSDAAHAHTDTCYQTNSLCNLVEEPGHAHERACYNPALICEQAEIEGHAHGDTCYAQLEVLLCQADLEGYEQLCEKPEVALHTHGETCYETYEDETGAQQKRLICPELEVLEHIHSEVCVVTEELPLDNGDVLTCTESAEDHTHTDRCYGTWALVCGKEEHTHTEECGIVLEYICGMEEHIHYEECMDKDGNMTCILEEHTHTEECVLILTDLQGDPIPECDCGSEIELKNHPNGCARYQYIRYTYIFEKTAEEIYANWEFMNEEDHDAILTFMSWEYTLTEKLAQLELLIENRDPTEVGLDDGTVISVDGIPEDAVLMASIASEEKQDVAGLLNIGLKSMTNGFFVNEVYDITVEQEGEVWQPENGDTVTLTLETNAQGFNYRSYLRVIHILDDADAILRNLRSKECSIHTQAGLSEIFPEACEAALSAGFSEDTIVYAILTPEDGSVAFDYQGNVTIHADSFSTYVVTAFNVDNSHYLRGVAGETEGELLVDKHVSFVQEDKFLLELEAFITGEIKSAPTDVVLVIDHSGSMWSAVDPAKKLSFSAISSDTAHGTHEGYYVCFGKNDTGADAAALVRYYNGQWQRSKWFATGDAINASKGFINTIVGTSRGWTNLSATDKTYTFYKSISGALYDALNIFMEEMQYAIDCRVAVVTFSGKNSNTYKGSGIFINGKLEFDQIETPGWAQSKYVDAFEDPSSESGKSILNQTVEAIDTDYGSTATGVGLLYARRLFLQASDSNRNKVAIVFTDGIPSPEYIVEREVENKENPDAETKEEKYGKYGVLYTSDDDKDGKWVSTYADQAKSLRDEGALVYSIGPVSGNAGVDVLEEMASGNDYFFNVGESDLRTVFKRIASVVVESSAALDKDAYLQDIIAEDFTLPQGITPSDVKAYVVPCVGKNYTFETDETKWTEISSDNISIDTATNTVQVRGFDYSSSNNFVVPTKAGGNKLLVRIPIDAATAGGTKLPTNTGTSAVCSKNGTPAKYFPMPYADIPVDVTLKKTVTGNIADPDLKFDFAASYTYWDGYKSIDGTVEEDSNYLQTIPKSVTGETFQLGNAETKKFSNLHVGSTMTITETMLSGYNTRVRVDGKIVYPDENGMITVPITHGMEIEFINHAGYELPETGGAGTYLYTAGGLLITAMAILLYIHNQRRRKEDVSSF